MVSKTKSIALAVIAAVTLNAGCAYHSAKKGLLNILESTGSCVTASLDGQEFYCKEFTGNPSTKSPKLMENLEVDDFYRETRISLDNLAGARAASGTHIGYDLILDFKGSNRTYHIPLNTKLQAEQAANYFNQLIQKSQ